MAYGYIAYRYTSEFVPVLVLGGAIGASRSALAPWPAQVARPVSRLVAVVAALHRVLAAAHMRPASRVAARRLQGPLLERYLACQHRLSGGPARRSRLIASPGLPDRRQGRRAGIRGDCDGALLQHRRGVRSLGRWSRSANRVVVGALPRASGRGPSADAASRSRRPEHGPARRRRRRQAAQVVHHPQRGAAPRAARSTRPAGAEIRVGAPQPLRARLRRGELTPGGFVGYVPLHDWDDDGFAPVSPSPSSDRPTAADSARLGIASRRPRCRCRCATIADAAGTTASRTAVRVTFLTWRDTGHPDGGGSEVYVEEIARRLVARGHEVTVLCARTRGPARSREHGVRFLRRGGRLTVYLHGLLHLLSPTGRRQDVVVEVINGLPFGARLVRRRGLVALVHHLHRDQWRMIYPGLGGRLGWFVESRVTPRLYRDVPHVTVSEATPPRPGRSGTAPRGVASCATACPTLPGASAMRRVQPSHACGAGPAGPAQAHRARLRRWSPPCVPSCPACAWTSSAPAGGRRARREVAAPRGGRPRASGTATSASRPRPTCSPRRGSCCCPRPRRAGGSRGRGRRAGHPDGRLPRGRAASPSRWSTGRSGAAGGRPRSRCAPRRELLGDTGAAGDAGRGGARAARPFTWEELGAASSEVLARWSARSTRRR